MGDNNFFDIEESDLEVPEILQFKPLDAVEFQITDFQPIEDRLKVIVQVLTGDHKGKIHKFYVNKKVKSLFKDFVTAFWTREEIKEKKIHPSKIMDRKFSALPGKPREYNGKMYQDLTNFKDLGPADTEESTEDIPF